MQIAVAHPNRSVLRGLSMLLEEGETLDVVTQAESLGEVVERTSSTRHDLIVLDSMLDSQDFDAILRTLENASGRPSTIIVSGYPELDEAHRALRAGARGYLSLNASPETLRSQLYLASEGCAILCEEVAEGLAAIVAMRPEEFGQPDSAPQPEELTSRELEVLTQLAAGGTNSEIAAALIITENTVKAHVSNILSKLDLKNRQQATGYALQTNLIPEVHFVTENSNTD